MLFFHNLGHSIIYNGSSFIAIHFWEKQEWIFTKDATFVRILRNRLTILKWHYAPLMRNNICKAVNKNIYIFCFKCVHFHFKYFFKKSVARKLKYRCNWSSRNKNSEADFYVLTFFIL